MDFERGKPGEEELSEKELCYMLMIYKEEITKYADRLLGIYNESYILRNISIDLDEIINNYIKS